MLVCGSSVSGSLAAMFRTFFWASADGGSTRPMAPSDTRSPRAVTSQLERDMSFSSFAGRATGMRDQGPDMIRDIVDGHRAERDSSMTTSVESVQDGSRGWARARQEARVPPSRLGDTIYEPQVGHKRSDRSPIDSMCRLL